jgi:hypothetical protein
MDKDKNIAPKEPTADEIEAENNDLKEVDENELREKIAEDLGIDPEEQSDLLDKAVQREVEHHNKLSAAIGQKIKFRKALKSKTSDPKPKAKETEDAKTTVREQVLSVLEEERLNDMDVPEELKKDIQKIAKLEGISVKKASKDPYIIHKKEELEEAAKVQKATISRKNKGDPIKFEKGKIPDFDVSTKEGQKKWEKWKQKMRAQE